MHTLKLARFFDYSDKHLNLFRISDVKKGIESNGYFFFCFLGHIRVVLRGHFGYMLRGYSWQCLKSHAMLWLEAGLCYAELTYSCLFELSFWPETYDS